MDKNTEDHFLEYKFSRYALLLVLSCFVWFTVILYIALASIPFNPFSLSYSEKNSIFILAPQGWGFFTRDCREVEILVYKKVNGHWTNLDKSGSDPSYYFGISRISRKISFEKSALDGKIRDSTLWINGEYPFNEYLMAKSPVTKVVNDFKQPILTGEFLWVKKENVPWAWSSQYYAVKMPYKYIHVISVPPSAK